MMKCSHKEVISISRWLQNNPEECVMMVLCQENAFQNFPLHTPIDILQKKASLLITKCVKFSTYITSTADGACAKYCGDQTHQITVTMVSVNTKYGKVWVEKKNPNTFFVKQTSASVGMTSYISNVQLMKRQHHGTK